MASSYRERSGRERRSEVETKRVFSLKTPLETLKMFNVLWGGSQFERTTGAVARSFRANSENEGLSFPPQPVHSRLSRAARAAGGSHLREKPAR